MKRILGLLVFVCVMMFVAAPANAMIGYIYQDAVEPGNGYTSVPISKAGSTTCTSFFHLVGLGDCSVEKAMKNGKIRSLSFYDVHTKNILGYQRITIKAYGQ